MRRSTRLSILPALVLLVGACSTAPSRPWWYSSGVTTCGTPAQIRVAGRVHYLGGCAGQFVSPAEKLTIHLGQRLDIHMAEDSAGPSGRLRPIFALPRSSDSSILALIDRATDQATATFEARKTGHVWLLGPFACSSIAQRPGACPVLDITVVT